MRHTVVFPTRVRRRALRHAFEEALEAAQEDGQQLELALEGPGHGKKAPQRFHNALHELADRTEPRAATMERSFASAYHMEARAYEAPPTIRPRAAAEAAVAAVKTGLTERDLKALRRGFAAHHHPDRVPAEFREEAERAMALVNAEIDAALKRIG